MTLGELLDKQFGVKTRTIINPLVTTLTGGVDRVLANNPNRLAWLIVNLGANSAYGSWLRDPSSTKGFVLSALGGSASLMWNEDFELTGQEVWVTGTAADTIYVVEVVTAE